MYSQLLISQSQNLSQTTESPSKFSGSRKFTLRFQLFQITGVEI